jgi:thiol:disulfide interchange protein
MKIKKSKIIVLVLLLLTSNLFAQLNPVKWTTSIKSISNDKYLINLKADIDKGYHVYTHDLDPNIGPIPLSVTYEKKLFIKPEKIAVKGKKITAFDEAFGAELSWYEHEFIISQEITTKPNTKLVEGTIEYMVCNDQSCMPGSYDFSLIPPSNNINTLNQADDSTKTIIINEKNDEDTIVDASNSSLDNSNFNWDKIDKNCFTSTTENNTKNILWIFFLGFLGGLLALITPCVFPLIPMTVSYFTKDKKNIHALKHALVYGLSIILIYVGLGVVFTSLFGADVLNILSTSAIFNVLFFIIFVIFAISFFGAFEITLPSKWSTKADQLSFKTGYIGIFFMAFTLALVSFSCTGPIIGSLLVQAATGGGPTLGIIKINPLMGMLGFSIALALPFTLFAMFPQWLQAMPKSGGWLGKVKVILGFLELAFAFKFLSVADMTSKWGILRWEPFLIIWIIIFLLLGLYALGIYPFKKVIKNEPKIFKVIGILSLAFVPYLFYGLITYKPLSLLSGLAPPTYYNFFNKDIKEGAQFHDFDKAVEYAKAHNMPIMIDFTGYGCVNCRKMEENVWSQSQVDALLKQYVLVSLYTDSREELPESKYYYSDLSGTKKKINNVGEFWTDFEIKHFKKASQPYYVIIDAQKNILTDPVAFTDAATYEQFLSCGLKNFKSIK